MGVAGGELVIIGVILLLIFLPGFIVVMFLIRHQKRQESRQAPQQCDVGDSVDAP